jgi:predicted DNA binding CopG/RHH family protein
MNVKEIKSKTVSVRLPPEKIGMLKRLAAEKTLDGIAANYQDLIRQAIDDKYFKGISHE